MPKLKKSRPATAAMTRSQPAARMAMERPSRKKAGPNHAASGRADTRTRPGTKLASLIALLSRKQGATIADLVKATDWQAHSVRGAISGTLKKKFGLAITSERIEGQGRVYRVAGRH